MSVWVPIGQQIGALVRHRETLEMKNILLVYPEVPKNTFWSYNYALKMVGKRSVMPPLGLITVASLFPATYHLKLVDMNIEPLEDGDVRWADAVFVSAMIIQQDSLRHVIETCSRLETKIIVGGPYPTSSHEEIAGVDHFVLGEVEDTFRDILMDLGSGKAKKVYPAPRYPELSEPLIPRFDLLDLKSYGSMSVQYSRGCPFKCEFCDIWSLYGSRPRVKTPSHLLSELETLYDLGWRGSVFVVDDNFIGNKRRVKSELLPALVDWHRDHHFPFRFFTEASINMADDETLLALMRDAGFNEVFVGIETPSAEALKETHKAQNLKINMQKAIRKIQSYGMGVMAGFILGFDSDKDDIFDRQIAFIQEAGIPRAMVGLLTATPGTELFSRLKREGRLLGGTGGNNTHSMETNFRTRMDAGELKEGYTRVLSAIYDSNLKNYFARCSKLLENIGNAPFYQRDIHLDEFLVLVRSVFRQPFTPYGFQYVKFVVKSLFKHPKSFSEAIALSIVGHHYHTITRETLKAERISRALEDSYTHLREQVNVYAETIRSNYREGIQNLVGLWEQKSKTLADIGRRIDGIHVDFRADVREKYRDVEDKIRGLFNVFEPDLMQYGIII